MVSAFKNHKCHQTLYTQYYMKSCNAGAVHVDTVHTLQLINVLTTDMFDVYSRYYRSR